MFSTDSVRVSAFRSLGVSTWERNCWIVWSFDVELFEESPCSFRISCTILHSHPPCTRVPAPPHLPVLVILVCFFLLTVVTLVDVKWFYLDFSVAFDSMDTSFSKPTSFIFSWVFFPASLVVLFLSLQSNHLISVSIAQDCT